MADRGGRGAGVADLAPAGPDRIRNVVLVGPSQSGKTSLLEALLVQAGALTRAGAVEDGTTVGDHDEIEHAHGRSVSLTVAPVVHAGVKVNLIDTPGYADFVGEVRAGLRAADCALFVLGAHEAADESTRELWRECALVDMPRALVLSKLDHARADVGAALESARSAFGTRVLPAYVADGERVRGLVTGAGDDPRRGELIEAIIEESEDETLMDRYVAGEQIEETVLLDDLEKAVARATLFPAIPVCAAAAVGLAELLDLCVRAFPSPPEHPPPELFTPAGKRTAPVDCDPDGPLVAEIVKTTSDPYLGRVSLARVFSGSLRPDAPVHVSGHFASFGTPGHADHDEDERIGGLGYPFGAQQAPAPQVVAGDLGLISRLSRAETGDTLSAPEDPRVLRPWAMPDPLLPVAVAAASRAAEEKLSEVLSRLAAEDPSLRVEQQPETGQLIVWVLGEAHAEVALHRLRERYGVEVTRTEVTVPLRETFPAPAKGHGRHVKQSGGHGQYAVCDLEVEPLPEGSGLEFTSAVVGGAVPRQFVPSVEKGVRTQMERGLRAGYPVVDLRVRLVDGKAHSVDSSDAAFQAAGALALRDAAGQVSISLLEPYDEVTVAVPDDLVGAVMSDLATRHGRPLGTDLEDGRSLVRAVVPQRGLVRYAVDLRAMTHGTGSFIRAFSHYEPVPDEVARAVSPRE